MADNVNVTEGTGTSIAADDINGVKYQRVKLTLGADGVNEGDVSLANPIPVKDVSNLPVPTGKYISKVEIMPSGTLGDGTVFFSIYNPVGSGKRLGLDRLVLQSAYIGSSYNSVSIFRLERFSSSSGYSGGTVSSAVKAKTTYPNTQIVIRTASSGLTAPSPTPSIDMYFHEHIVRHEKTVADAVTLNLANGSEYDELFFIEEGEGFNITADGTVLGSTILVGSIYWHEYVV